MFILKTIKTKLVNYYHHNLLVNYLKIKKTSKLAIQKNNKLTGQHKVKVYIKNFDIYLAIKKIYYKLYNYLPLFLISIYYSKN